VQGAETERTSKLDLETARVLAFILCCLGILIVATSFLQWASWSPDPVQGTTHVSIGGGTAALAIAALGLALSLMGFQALNRPTSWQFGVMLFTALVTLVAALGVLQSRSSTAHGLANALIRHSCFEQCGTPDVNPGPGFWLSMLMAAAAVVCALVGATFASASRGSPASTD
jgi:hypothetical protein